LAWKLDARIPVEIAAGQAALAAALATGPAAAVLSEGPAPADRPAAQFESVAPHVAGCACCGGRPVAAPAFDRLFLARVRGDCAWFDRVVALAETPAARAAITAALAEDAVTAARFRPA
jgi:hypothetical protein